MEAPNGSSTTEPKPPSTNRAETPSNRPELAQAATRTGAYPFAAGSNDAAALVVLNPGAYSLLVSGVSGSTGIALLEVYEVN